MRDMRERKKPSLAACKPFTDGLIDAGVIFYDDIEHLETGLNRTIFDTKDETVITIAELRGNYLRDT